MKRVLLPMPINTFEEARETRSGNTRRGRAKREEESVGAFSIFADDAGQENLRVRMAQLSFISASTYSRRTIR